MDDKVRAIFEGLNPEQARAVGQTEGPVLIVAGAGSGKTRVLTTRIAHLLAKGVPSSKVLSLTFTKKAAGEMKERVATMVGARNARGVVMGTFHSVFIRFLRDYADSLGYPREFTVYDTSDSTSLIKTCLKELELDEKVYKPKNVLGRISDAKNNLVSPAAYMANTGAMDHDKAAKMPRLVEVYDAYWKACRRNGVMDFDDILFNMNILLRDNQAALQEIASRFDYILVDEYQDTNRAQYVILKKLAERHHNICVVGDDSQSIYAFRGAKIQNILNFRKDYPESKVFRLEQNYRSTATIVEAANSLIAHNENRIPKECYSSAGKGELIRLIRAYTEQEEATLIVSGIADKIRNERAEYQDFAVLYRTNAQSRAIEESLRRRNIPYIIYSGNSFFDRMEVKDLMAYFKLTCNLSDDESFKRVVNKPARGIGDTSIAALIDAARHNGVSLMQAAMMDNLEAFGLKAAGLAKIRAFAEMISGFNARLASTDAYELASAIAVDSTMLGFYKSDTSIEGQSRLANVEELLNSVKAFIEQRENEVYEDAIAAGEDPQEGSSITVTLFVYIENVALLSAVDVDDDNSNKVALMTVHSSKGLEFPHVFVAGLEENLFPSGGMMARPSDIEEERRLFYVAMTRAKKTVTLSFCNTRMRNGQSESNAVSRFVGEIDKQYIENPLAEGMKQAKAEAFWSSVNNSPKGSLYGNSGRMPWQKKQTTQNTVPTPSPVRKPVFQHPPQRVPDENFECTPIMNLRAGQRVEHNRFGFGQLLEIINEPGGMKVKVDFDDFGEKLLLMKYAKLRVI